MYKHLMGANLFFILTLSIVNVHAITATEILNERVDADTSSSELTELIKQLPPLTLEESEKAKHLIEDARLQSDSCRDLSCFPGCMLAAGAAVCCNDHLCIGGDCGDSGDCIGNPSKNNEYAGTACGIYCLFK